MQPVIPLHKHHINDAQHPDACPQASITLPRHHDHCLHRHVDGCYPHVWHPQFIRHQL